MKKISITVTTMFLAAFCISIGAFAEDDTKLPENPIKETFVSSFNDALPTYDGKTLLELGKLDEIDDQINGFAYQFLMGRMNEERLRASILPLMKERLGIKIQLAKIKLSEVRCSITSNLPPSKRGGDLTKNRQHSIHAEYLNKLKKITPKKETNKKVEQK